LGWKKKLSQTLCKTENIKTNLKDVTNTKKVKFEIRIYSLGKVLIHGNLKKIDEKVIK